RRDLPHRLHAGGGAGEHRRGRKNTRARHRPPRLQNRGGAQRFLIFYGYPCGLIQAGEGGVDQRHQPVRGQHPLQWPHDERLRGELQGHRPPDDQVLQIRYASVERLLERLTDLRFLSIDFLNTFLHSYRVFTTALVVLDKLITIYKKPISAIPARSLELLFANSQNNKLLYGEPPKSPRANRKFSSPPPLSITKSSSPSRRRKLSLNIPIITGGKALDLAALSCSSNGYASMYSSMAPFSKTTLDINKLYVASNYPNKIPDEGEAASEKHEETLPSKQRESL
ncbi:PREDICTED: ras-specific guanine nucleotide-releasing factor 1-like, partial [Apaloderma vittatum]|uniref:ras-specific guanine nucleotide-releasing factor 1-like n=1 Tax=Apaloderma vittatum TaxID=57397 RepID=UPI000521291F